MLIPQVFNGVEVRSASRPYHLLHSNILEVDPDKPRPVGASVVILEDRVRSQTVEIWDCHWQARINPLGCPRVTSHEVPLCPSALHKKNEIHYGIKATDLQESKQTHHTYYIKI
jgi:hypothetical protein